MRSASWRVALLTVAAATSACTGVLSPNCTDVAKAAIAVDILDSATGETAVAGARAIAVEGEYADTAFSDHVATVGPYLLAFERPGTYTLTVEKPGYQPWSRSGIRVTDDRCHVRSVRVTALLQKP